MSFFRSNKLQNQEQTQSFVNQRRHILGKNSSFYVQEAYKTLRTNVNFTLSGEGCKKFCITSGVAAEGKSITILNLAISFAQAGKRVLLVDADMRRPTLAKLMIEQASPGLSNILAGQCSEQEAVRTSEYPNLDVIFSGEIPPNPSELLGNPRMQRLLDKLSAVYDYILLDTPPVGIVADACVLAGILDGVLLLVRQHRTEKDTVSRSVKQLEMSGAKLLGFVLNGSEKDGKGRYGKKYKYRYKYGYYRYSYDTSRNSRTDSATEKNKKESTPKAKKKETPNEAKP